MSALSDYDIETVRQMCELEVMLIARHRKQLERDPAMRARANRFMPAAALEAAPCVETVVAGAHQEKAA